MPNIEKQLPAMWPLLMNCPHIGHLSVLFQERRRVLQTPHINSIVCELSRCEGGVSTMVGKICSVSFGSGEKVAVFGSVAVGSDGGGETMFLCI
jgi:hypothetical protein